MPAITLFLELTLLFFLSNRVIQALYTLVYLLVRHRSFAIHFLTLLLFPGTVIHELSHLFTAEILGVRTGKLTLTPEAIRGTEIQTGSVAIAKTDPFRHAVIGLAPLLWGITAYSFLSSWFTKLLEELMSIPRSLWFSSPTLPSFLFTLYLLFAISNSMFPSAQDARGISAVGIATGMLLLAAYIVGFRLTLSERALEVTVRIITSLTQSTTLVLALNSFFLLCISLVTTAATRFLHRRTIL